MKTKAISLATLVVLAACGGGGSDDSPPPVAATPQPAPAPAPKPTADDFPILVPVTQPTPVTPPVSQAPVATPPAPPPDKPNDPPVAQPPAPPPQPAEGTYITGAVLLKALLEHKNDGTPHEAFPTQKLDSKYPDAVRVNYYDGGLYFSYDTYPVLYRPYWEKTNFEPVYMQWDVSYNTGDFTLSQNLVAYAANENTVLWRDAGFTIKADDKFILNKTFAQWSGVTGTDWFLQLQVQDYNGLGADPKLSTAAFNLCVHHFLPKVRRLSCTIHDRVTGQFRGTRVVDDSDGLGPVEWLPRR